MGVTSGQLQRYLAKGYTIASPVLSPTEQKIQNLDLSAAYKRGYGAPSPTIQGGYQTSGGVANPIENLTPQQRIAGGAGSTFDFLRSNPALAATGSFLTNAASRIAGLFGPGNFDQSSFPPSANAAQPSPTPIQTPPPDELIGYNYGTSNVQPRRYSDYY